MSGQYNDEAINLFTEWREDMATKSRNLTKGGRFYRVANFLVKICVAAFTVILLVLETVFLSDATLSYEARLSLYIIVLCFQIALAIFNAGDAVVKPGNKSNECSICSKQYNELVREFDITTLNLRYDSQTDIIDRRELQQKLLYYSSKEQLIHQLEPMLVWIGHKKEPTIDLRKMATMHSEDYVP